MTDEVEAKVVQFNVSLVPIGQVDDNPYNPRKSYLEEAIKAMAESLKANGILQVPEGRMHNGRIQLAFGHMRLRGVKLNAQGGNARWQQMPVILKEISDADMFHKTIEENLQRSEVTPLEVARSIARFSEAHPEIKDKDIAKKHGMSEGQISNMKRVLRLPEKFLAMIDEGTLTFTQGRELLTLEEMPEAEQLMSNAVMGLTSYSVDANALPNTVEGLKESIQNTIQKSPGALAALLPKKPRAKSTKAVTTNISQEKSTRSPGTVRELVHAIHTNDSQKVDELTAGESVELAKPMAELPTALPGAAPGTTAPDFIAVIEVVEEKLPRQPKQSGGVVLTGDDVHDTLCRIGWWLEERAVYPFPYPLKKTRISVRILNTDIKAFQEGRWPEKLEGEAGG